MKTSLNSKYNTERLKEIVSILTKYGISDWLENIDNEKIKNYLKTDTGKDILNLSKPVRLRMALNELGTTFIKFGQVLSTRSDIVGYEVAQELSKLQSSAKADGIAKIRTQIKKEFGIKSVNELFQEFSTKPIASASIAQVHKAILNTGEEVVVKVMHPNIEEKVIEDLNILMRLAGTAEKFGGSLRLLHPLQLAKQFKQTLLDELDFIKELQNIEKFTNNFKDDNRVTFPVPFREYSGKTVLTMTFLNGTSLDKVDTLKWNQELKTKFAEESADVFMDMMFRDQFYHADPHPGNLLVQEDGTLGIIDCGMVHKIDSKTNAIFEELIIGVAQKNAEHIKNTIFNMFRLPNDVDYDALTYQIETFVDKYLGIPLNAFDMSSAMKEVTSIIKEHHISIPPNMSSLMHVVGLLEGSSKLLNPNFNIAVLFEKHQYKILKRRLSPKTIVKKMIKNAHQWNQIIESFPSLLDKLLKKANTDNFNISLEHKNLEKSINRIVMGLITSAVFLGSAMLWSFKVPPVINGYSIFGIIGVVIASVLSYRLIKEINKSEKE